MTTVLQILAFPVLASALAVVWVELRAHRQRTAEPGVGTTRPARRQIVRQVAMPWLVCQVLGAWAFGVWLVLRQAAPARDALWFLPLVLAPLEYAMRFGPYLLLAAAGHVLLRARH